MLSGLPLSLLTQKLKVLLVPLKISPHAMFSKGWVHAASMKTPIPVAFTFAVLFTVTVLRTAAYVAAANVQINKAARDAFNLVFVFCASKDKLRYDKSL